MGFTILESILSVFLIALVVTVVFRRLRLSVILGYLLVGAVVGPHALGLIPDSDNLKELAEFGIVFLMFTIGLEFSLPKLWALKYPVFVIGSLQVLFCVLITTAVGTSLGMSTLSAFVTGIIVSMSSTAMVVKQLADQRELHTPYGLNSIGILLFQDLAVIPFIILIASLVKDTGQSLPYLFLWAFLKGVLAILLIFILGRWLLRPLFHLIAKTRAIELFTLTVLLVTLTAAWLTHLFGLSFALGAFLAGIMLAETEFRHQIEIEIRPFRDILLGLFFITIGMLTDVSHWPDTWKWIAVVLFAIIIVKMFVIVVVSRLAKNSYSVSLRTGLVLAQGGEFGFAILTLALSYKILPPDHAQIVLAALLISLALSPLLIYFNKQIAAFLMPQSKKMKSSPHQLQLTEKAKTLRDHVIICGYGRVGQQMARFLDKINFPYIGLDLDSELVQRANLAGDNVIYGEATHPQILKTAGVEHAKVLVISLSDLKSAIRILSMVRHRYPKLPILVRCRDKNELKQLKEFAPTQIIAELFEASLTLSTHLLQLIGMPKVKINDLIQEVRNSDYDLLQRVITGSILENETELELATEEQLSPILIPEGSYAVDRTLSEFDFKAIQVEVIALRRDKFKQSKPHANTKLQANDILVLYGKLSQIEQAEEWLLEGK